MISMNNNKPLFDLGQVVGTVAALEAIEAAGQMPHGFIQKHVTGEFGDLGHDDKQLNFDAIEDGSRILSAYNTRLGVRLYVISEAKDDEGRRAATTILLVSEY